MNIKDIIQQHFKLELKPIEEHMCLVFIPKTEIGEYINEIKNQYHPLHLWAYNIPYNYKRHHLEFPRFCYTDAHELSEFLRRFYGFNMYKIKLGYNQLYLEYLEKNLDI
jgi:hypothetical protein